MRCSECHHVFDDNLKRCPNCGNPVDAAGSGRQQKNTGKGPKLGRGMMLFNTFGLLFLIVFGAVYYIRHLKDPEYFRTVIEPDTTLADKDAIYIDTAAINAQKRDSIEREERKEAEKVFNSVRIKPKTEEAEEESETEGTREGEASEAAPTAPAENLPDMARPKVESIEE